MSFHRESVLFAFFAAVLSGVAAPTMPMGFETQTTNATGRTWRETGILSQPYAMAMATVRASMLGQGYGVVHDIDEGPNATRSLQLWRREDEDVILMLWQEDLYTTGVAWGLSARGDEAIEEEPRAESTGNDFHAEGAESAEPVPHAEFAVLDSHAETAESAEKDSHAEFAESELDSYAEIAESAEKEPLAESAEAEDAGVAPEEE